MIIQEAQTKTLLIADAPALDPITVYLHDGEPGCGKIVIECYCEAWAHYWGGMGGSLVGEFFCGCDASYLMGKFGGAIHDKHKAEYLRRVLAAVRDALAQHYHLPKQT